MIRLKHILHESVNMQHVINTNNKINSIVDKILTKIQNNTFSQRNKIQNIVKHYVNNLNSNAALIVKQISTGNGAETASLYLDTLKQLFYKEFNALNSITKFAITKYYTADELRNDIQNNMNLIDDIYDAIMINTLLYMHDPSVKSEVKWYDTAYNVLIKRRDSVIKHMLDWMISQLY
jgi:hypothetical protein